ncbi:centromere protein R isoform X1 [Engystomops pustulosus]|uniref:centromere protein R isoform X1 n=1 Tax=Engystomops pustulosus TaxID=76066 RepID=UPI003AFAD614
MRNHPARLCFRRTRLQAAQGANRQNKETIIVIAEHANDKSKIKVRDDPSSYSPITGTRQMSPSSASKQRAAMLAKEQRRQRDVTTGAAAPKSPSRGQSSPKENADILEKFSVVEGSLNEFLKMRQRLMDVQAVGGSRELGNLSGLDRGATDLQTEMQKAKVLICEVRKMKQRRQRTG